jgi:hypothetical protein
VGTVDVPPNEKVVGATPNIVIYYFRYTLLGIYTKF